MTEIGPFVFFISMNDPLSHTESGWVAIERFQHPV
jgi:hypothetical protein